MKPPRKKLIEVALPLDAINKASREIEKQSNGRVKMVWYFGAVMGDEVFVVVDGVEGTH